jgi:hypothetical protein
MSFSTHKTWFFSFFFFLLFGPQVLETQKKDNYEVGEG